MKNKGSVIFLENNILWWAQVTKTPEESKIAVFKRGILKGLKGITDTGGHNTPISCVGTVLWWKKAQNQAIKKRISLKINKPIPHFKPSWTLFVWSPIKEPSRVTSRHHRKEKINIITEDRKTENTLLILNINTKDLIIKRTPTPHIKGHGLIVTIWKEWKRFIIGINYLWLYSKYNGLISHFDNFLKNIKKVIYKIQKVELKLLKFLK